MQASTAASEDGRAALAELCARYWWPLYALARRGGRLPAAAEDAVQQFFEGLLRRGDVERADREKGSFRAYLSTAFRHSMAQQSARERTLKRGGALVKGPLDPEANYAELGQETDDPAALFERAFALRTLEVALEELRKSYEDRGRTQLFEALRSCITAPDASIDRRAVAAELGMTRGALDVAIHRLRERYREALLGTLRDITESDAAAEDELRWMFEVL